MNPQLAYELIQICAEVNDGHGLTLECGNTSCRIYLPDAVDMPAHMPEGAALVVFAGSNDFMDWVKNISIFKRPMMPFGDVHGGMLDCYEKIQKALHIALAQHRDIVFAGHSLGGAEAILAAADFYQRGHNIHAVYTFGSPRVASQQFRDALRASGVDRVVYRIVVGMDPVVRCPDSFDDYHCGKGWFYTPSGESLKSQQRPPIWKAFLWIWKGFIDSDHIAANEYKRALRRVSNLA